MCIGTLVFSCRELFNFVNVVSEYLLAHFLQECKIYFKLENKEVGMGRGLSWRLHCCPSKHIELLIFLADLDRFAEGQGVTLSEAGTLVNPSWKCHAVTWQVEEVALAYNKQQGTKILEYFSLSSFPVLTVLSVCVGGGEAGRQGCLRGLGVTRQLFETSKI